MAVTKTDFTYTSSVGDCEIHATKWIPENAKAIFNITHGMAEHIERYEGFAEFLAENGFAVYAHDHIGHGKSINGIYKAGYFGDKNAEGTIFVDDNKLIVDIAKEENPGLPVFFFGHSMGSFVTRKYIALYGEGLKGAIICGTGGPNPATGVAILLANLAGKIKGFDADGKFINGLAFGTYNKKTAKRTGFDWLTKDEAIVDKYIADPLCGFLFSNNGFKDMLGMLGFVNSADCYANTPKALPLLIISGADDPVGEYGKGVEKVAAAYKANGNPVDLKLYAGDRHEILNEFDKETVMNDILAWLNKNV
ncbi:MAG: alpha/beta hydrolase [Clostridia bacterium]|nr:alpha/beta hydrolase [Clostridia bacterium]MBR5976555.1 alpha/beta hydrolase [Clostridia bacterium]